MKNYSSYSPEPWIVSAASQVDGATDYSIVSGGQVIAEVFGRSSIQHFHPSQGNARVMAASLQMLAALKSARVALGSLPRHSPAFDEVQAAINLATGGRE